jgi:hypothetical protein
VETVPGVGASQGTDAVIGEFTLRVSVSLTGHPPAEEMRQRLRDDIAAALVKRRPGDVDEQQWSRAIVAFAAVLDEVLDVKTERK